MTPAELVECTREIKRGLCRGYPNWKQREEALAALRRLVEAWPGSDDDEGCFRPNHCRCPRCDTRRALLAALEEK